MDLACQASPLGHRGVGRIDVAQACKLQIGALDSDQLVLDLGLDPKQQDGVKADAQQIAGGHHTRRDGRVEDEVELAEGGDDGAREKHGVGRVPVPGEQPAEIDRRSKEGGEGSELHEVHHRAHRVEPQAPGQNE